MTLRLEEAKSEAEQSDKLEYGFKSYQGPNFTKLFFNKYLWANIYILAYFFECGLSSTWGRLSCCLPLDYLIKRFITTGL